MRERDWEEQRQKLREWILQAEGSLKGKPEGCLEICGDRGRRKYYLRETGKRHGKYIPKEDFFKACALAQKSYDQCFLMEANKMLRELDQSAGKGFFMDWHDFYEKLARIYQNMSPARQELVNPYVLPDDLFVQEWLGKEYSGKAFPESCPLIYTERGERVRSKSEKMIADKYFLMGIPYRYEYPIWIDGFGEFHPDFTLLDVRTRKEILHEHFGMIDDPDYRRSMLFKINAYEEGGYQLGIDFFFTMETGDQPLNTLYLEHLLKNRLDL